MNLPNALTLLRIFFVPLLVAALVQEHGLFALAVFLAAAGTDLLDGYLARRWGQITTVGTLLDPIADKLLISAALVSLVQVRMVPAWMTILIIGREFAITGLRSIAAAEGYVIKANELGKTKLVAQVAAISLVLLSMHWPFLRPYADVALWAVVVFAMASALVYFRQFWRRIDLEVKRRRRRELLALEREERLTTIRRKAEEGATAEARPTRPAKPLR
jgi:CDP-diacylglycerol--glycerol-3-phosphate 3-phosphatidyltransferase